MSDTSREPDPAAGLTRRQLLRDLGATTVGFGGLWLLSCGSSSSGRPAAPVDLDFGPLLPDPAGQVDLPAGFRYTILSFVGQEMSDGLKVPAACDGMAAFPGLDDEVILVRNHELVPSLRVGGAFGNDNERLNLVDRNKIYDLGGAEMHVGLGGTTTLVYDPTRDALVRQFLSLAGTELNCAGGRTPWGSWLSCEETTARPDDFHGEDHGYVFEVPATATPGLVDPVPLRAMGRFRHEAVAVDPRTGILYLTEDMTDGLFYRFRPHVPGQLQKGGVLEALALSDQPSAITASGFAQGQPLAVSWIPLQDVEAPNDDLRMRGFQGGAAQFSRGEGVFAGEDGIYFTCTSGGARGIGQIWRYRPGPLEGSAEEARQPGQLELFLESRDPATMHYADNLTVAPWGDIVFCEDGGGIENGGNRLMGVARSGDTYPLAMNRSSTSEFAGITFSPDGRVMFVNVQFPGATLAIHGPWPTSSLR